MTEMKRQMTKEERLKGPEHLGDPVPTPEQGGSKGGDLAEEVGSRDELKRAFERPGGATRVRKSDQES